MAGASSVGLLRRQDSAAAHRYELPALRDEQGAVEPKTVPGQGIDVALGGGEGRIGGCQIALEGGDRGLGGVQIRLPFPEVQWDGGMTGPPGVRDIYFHLEGWGRSADNFGRGGVNLSAVGVSAGVTLLL